MTSTKPIQTRPGLRGGVMSGVTLLSYGLNPGPQTLRDILVILNILDLDVS